MSNALEVAFRSGFKKEAVSSTESASMDLDLRSGDNLTDTGALMSGAGPAMADAADSFASETGADTLPSGEIESWGEAMPDPSGYGLDVDTGALTSELSDSLSGKSPSFGSSFLDTMGESLQGSF